MKIRKLAAVSVLVLSSFAATGVAPTKSQLESMYDKAFQEFDSNHYSEALRTLDAIDARQPDLAESQNLRGVVLMRQGEYDKAEVALRKALDLEPKFWNANFNLAEIPFLKKNWAEARNRFEVLMAGNGADLQREASELIQYKILLTFLLEGKKEMVDWMVNKFELSQDTPALYYANAAIALQHENQKEAKEWTSAAEKHFSPQLNKLFAESFYEIGWLQKPANATRAALEITSASERADRMGADAKANFEKAERAFQQRDFDGALKLLDQANEGAPNQAAFYNLRGEILMEQNKFDEAEAALRQATEIDPKFREAQYNLAQIPFKKKEYAKSRERLTALINTTPDGGKNQAAQLIKYKIFMTLLLEGKEDPAQKMMDQFKFTGDTPALYYAQAAWAFAHKNPEQGNDWIASARKIYSPALNIVFADSFYDLGWLQNPAQPPPTTGALAQANASPPTEPPPAMRFGQASPLPAPTVGENTPAPATETMAATTTTAPATEVAAAIAASSPVAVRAATAAPITATAAPNERLRARSPIAKLAAPAVVAANASVTPAATALAPARIREWSRPSFAEMMDRAANPHTLLVAGLLFAGILILLWLVIQQLRRQLPAGALYQSSVPLTEPPFLGDGAMGAAEAKLPRSMLVGGPPKFSLQLKASEPSVRTSVLPSGATGARAAVPTPGNGASAPNEFTTTSPNDFEESVSEARPVPKAAVPPVAETPSGAEGAPLRDQEEVSLAAFPEPFTTAVRPEISEPASVLETLAVAAPLAPSEAKDLGEPVPVPEFASPDAMPVEELVLAQEEPVGQGQPIPQLTPVFTLEPVMSELTQPESEPASAHIAPETAAAAVIAGSHAVQSSVETPSFAPKIITTESIEPQSTTPITMLESTLIRPIPTQSTTPVIMPESTPITAINEPRPVTAINETRPVTAQDGTAPQPSATMQTAVQLTLSLEIASLQLTPAFKMGSMQLRPISKIVSMRLAPSAQPQPAMNLQVTFELSSLQLGPGATIGSVRLTPSSAQRPTPITSPTFEISGLQLVSNFASAPVQLTPSHQTHASVLMTASFQIATVEFSPSFEIASVVLNCTSKNVAVQLPGAGPSSIEGAPVFEIGNVQLSGGNDLGLIQLNPLGGSVKRA